jgi:hypothetical protein
VAPAAAASGHIRCEVVGGMNLCNVCDAVKQLAGSPVALLQALV